MLAHIGHDPAELHQRERLIEDTVETGRADDVDARDVFAELSDAGRALPGRSKVQVRELGDRVAQRVIHLALRLVPAVDMSDDALSHVPRRRGGEGFDAVTANENDVRLQLRKRSREPRHRIARGGGRGVGIGGGGWPTDLGIDRPAFVANGVDAAAVLLVQVHARHGELELEIGMRPDRAERGLHEAELGARAGDEANFATGCRHGCDRIRQAASASMSHVSSVPAGSARLTRLPMAIVISAAGMPVPGR